MSDSILKELLKEYEQKRILETEKLENRIQMLYVQYPDLEKIEDNLNQTCIEKAKAIISGAHTDSLAMRIAELKKQKQDFLTLHEINPNVFSIHYTCSFCEDTGYISKNYTTKMCHCLKQKLLDLEYNKSNIGNIKQENFSTFDLSVYSDQIDEKKYNSKISPKENIKMIRKLAEHFVDHFNDPEEKNLLFTGNTGLGKTFLSNAIAKAVLDSGKTVLYQTAPVMLDSIIDYRFGKVVASQNLIQQLLDVDLLIIDDLGTETMNQLKFTELFNVINTRLLNQNKKVAKTIISTNLSLQNLFATYDERIVSRIVGYYHICRFYGDDLRFQLNKK